MSQAALSIPFASYQAIDAVNWSTLKHLRRSPLHYRHARENPPERTDAMVIGEVTHIAILEPRDLPRRVAIWDGGRRAGNDWWAFCEVNAGKAIVKAEDYDRCLAIGEAVRTHPIAGPIFARGQAEQTIRWTDPETRLACKGRIDWREAPAAIVDLKTARTIDLHPFAGAAWKLGYFHQLALYRRGIAAELRCSPETPNVRIVAVENTAPYDVAVYEPDMESLAAADVEVGKLLARLAECRARNEWPGAHGGEVEVLRAPVYALGDDYEWEVSSTEVA